MRLIVLYPGGYRIIFKDSATGGIWSLTNSYMFTSSGVNVKVFVTEADAQSWLNADMRKSLDCAMEFLASAVAAWERGNMHGAVEELESAVEACDQFIVKAGMP